MLRSGLILLLTACGPVVPDLVAEVPPPLGSEGLVTRGQARLSDRAEGRSGLACTDCHGVGGDVRPAPDLHGLASTPMWRGEATSLEAAIQRCAERYQRRLGPRGEALGDLVAALNAAANAAPDPGAAKDVPPTEPDALYDAACRGCHEAGPAGPLLGRPWPVAHLRARVLGPREPGPDRLMPTFPPERLPGAEALVRWLAAGGNARLPP